VTMTARKRMAARYAALAELDRHELMKLCSLKHGRGVRGTAGSYSILVRSLQVFDHISLADKCVGLRRLI
jgi:hypothetical protein